MKTATNLIEISWEVCNLVGGIHTVLASKAEQMVEQYGERYLVIGPYLPNSSLEFQEEIWNADLLGTLTQQGLECRMGRWTVPGSPRCVLVKFEKLHQSKDKILANYWEQYHLNSLYGGWDYIEPVLFGHAAGMIADVYFKQVVKPAGHRAIMQCHEWMTAAALLHLRQTSPEIGTVFTTHATVLARAMYGNNRKIDVTTHDAVKLDLLAHELGVSSKHSMEVVAAREADCFTTVSALTADECALLLGRRPDILLLNGIGAKFPDPDFAKPEAAANSKDKLFKLAQLCTGFTYDRENTSIFISAGRYEFKNKGIDLFLDSLNQLNSRMKNQTTKRVIAILTLPAGTIGPKKQLLEALTKNHPAEGIYYCTHELRDENHDPICVALKNMNMLNQPEQMVHVIFVPAYLDGKDPLITDKYYPLLAGTDLSVFPSFYEPWGYTPMESIALSVPTITSDLAGFGLWAEEQGSFVESGVCVIKRNGCTMADATSELTDRLFDFVHLPKQRQQKLKEMSLLTATKGHWSNWSKAYFEAHKMALKKAGERSHSVQIPISEVRSSLRLDPKTHMRNFVVLNQLPKKLEKLRELGKNISYYWDQEMESLFSVLDHDLWIKSARNPIVFLDYVKSEFLDAAAHSQAYQKKLDHVVSRFTKEQEERETPSIAFFCAEYGLMSCLRFYSGGLGILAGDIMKTASDMKLPMCGIGLAYSSGYFKQKINERGEQENQYEKTDFHSLPMQLVHQPDGHPLVVRVPFPTGAVCVRAWKIAVGSIDLYLLDTNFAANRLEDREITDKLYGGDVHHRLKQELILGIGGILMLKAMGISPQIYHMNEGHSAFLVLARLFLLMTEKNLDYDEAMEFVRHTSIFTTHTPVPAGHDEFPEEMIKPYLSPFMEALHKNWATLAALGKIPQTTANKFSMTYLCLRGSSRVNAVSEIHGHVSREMFKDLFSASFKEEIPVHHITNGVHVKTWLAPEWEAIFEKQLSPHWAHHLTDAKYWSTFKDIDNKIVWDAKEQSKTRLITWLKSHVEESFRLRREDPSSLAQALTTLDQKPLIIGFARRFAPYKRAGLLFRNLKRIESILTSGRPILFVYAGKAHPKDTLGQDLIKQVIEVSRKANFAGKVLYVENYDIDIARLLVTGCDVWLNTPTRPLEASGTSGMKAGINGTLNLSVADGWWAESHNGKNGWVIAGESESNPEDYQNEYDSVRLYSLLEQEVIPTYFDRDNADIPQKWVEMMKESIATIIPQFSSERMLGDYQRMFYKPALKSAKKLSEDNYVGLRHFAEFKRRIRQSWNQITFSNASIVGLEHHRITINEPVKISVELQHPNLRHDDIVVQAILKRSLVDKDSASLQAFPAKYVNEGKHKESSSWLAELSFSESGPYSLGVRVLPRQAPGESEPEFIENLIKWL